MATMARMATFVLGVVNGVTEVNWNHTGLVASPVLYGQLVLLKNRKCDIALTAD